MLQDQVQQDSFKYVEKKWAIFILLYIHIYI